jgi:hypothetical protein
MKKESMYTGHDGTGIYCSNCGIWRGSAYGLCIKTPEQPCYECHSTGLEIITHSPIILLITKTY